MSQPSTSVPSAQGLSFASHLSTGTLTRLLAVLCIWTQRDPYVDAVPQGTCTLTRFPLDHPEPTMPALGYSMMHCLAREQPSGDLHAAQITLSPPPPPISASLCSQCPVDVVSRRVSIVSRVPGFRGPRVKGFLGQNGLKGTKGPRASGFQGKVFNLRGHGFKGLICQSPLKCSKVPGRQVPKG